MDYSRYTRLEFRRKFFKIFGASIDVKDADTNSDIGFIQMKAWVLREDIRLYSDSSKQHELLRIHTRNIVDFGATYDVFDSSNDELLFSLRRQGLRSTFVRDHWDITDATGKAIANVQETSGGLALARRYIGFVPVLGMLADFILMVTPLTYTINGMLGGAVTGVSARITHRKNPFVVKMGLDNSGAEAPLDPRIGVAVASLLSVIDASKN
jgi:hypothetical protein